ncbi:MAG: Zn-ribbon-containing protein [Sphingobacteriales bacterium JAD_PAG50586_3]|nr:MAG: Zn-ribbon-containing protein [Sphingobacteriales bacterium JAD_PAG50586_3]
MFTHQISIQVKQGVDLAEAVSQFTSLIGSYYQNGQVLHKQLNTYGEDGLITYVAETQEEDSLNAKYNNELIKMRIGLLEEHCGNKLEIKLLGKSHEEVAVCNCNQRDFYLLIADHSSVDSPVKCGACFDVIPLYKLPPHNESGYYEILAWEQNYKGVDTLQINGHAGEEWATEQISNPNSELSIQGRAVCSAIEQNTSVKTYYYLHNGKETTVEEELDAVCPACKTPWLLSQPLAGGIFPFKCDNCRLVSTFSSNIKG